MPGSVNCSYITNPQWQQLPASDSIPGSNIYIWHGVTNNLLLFYDDCNAVLTDQERATSARFYHSENRTRYTIQHGILRLLLSKYTGINAKKIRFTYNENKKPYLQNPVANPCFFNLSHSADDFLIAVGPEEFGVDIEQINTKKHWEDIASQYFGYREVQSITTAQNPDEAFFLFWTRKEAFLKATGTGIDENLPEIIALDGMHPIPPLYGNFNWFTESFTVGTEFMGAVTYPAPQKNIILLTVDEFLMRQLCNG